MKNYLGAILYLLLSPCVAYGHEQPRGAPKPGPEVQKLGYYVGTWKGQGETKGGPFGAAGKLSSEQTCNWFTGRFHIVCQGEETGPSGKRAFLNVISYDQKTKAYMEHSISSFGETEDDSGGSFVGDRLVFLMGGGGKDPRIRYTEAHVSPILYTYRAEAAVKGGPWTLIAEGKIAKVR